MSEPKWWPKGVLPDVPGYYLSVVEGSVGQASWRLPDKYLQSTCKERTFYGPIPDPPKAPPKVRRFTATYKGEPVSGCIPENHFNSLLHIYRFDSNGRSYYVGQLREFDLDNIQWLDSEY